jgi:preprotein translocase subunit SecG
MSARGAADFLTRATSVLATVFVCMSIALAFYAASRQTQTIDTSLARTAPAAAPLAPAQDAVPNAPADNGVVPLQR